MKRNRLFLLVAMLPALAMQAQTSYEAAALLDTDLSGTSRFVGMGGAMSALGADMSTMSTNPAGTALYRSWDASLSFGGNWITQRTQTNLGKGRAFDAYGSFDNMGVVIANKQSNVDPVRFVNFGINYRNVKRFDSKMGMSSNLKRNDGVYLSQTGQMAWQAYQNWDVVAEDFNPHDEEGFFHRNYYKQDWVGWLTLLGAQGYLIDESALYEDLALQNKNYYPSNYNEYRSVQYGGIDAYDFNLSVNLYDAVYFGATFTTYDVDRTTESVYSERFDDGSYTLQNYYRTVGTGYDFKFGVILRPFEESSFRFGVSATTPTVYWLCDHNSAVLNSQVSFTNNETGESWVETPTINTRSSKAYGDDCPTNYTMIAPFKVNVSLGGTIGTSLALGAEYEYTDYSTTKLFYSDGVEMSEMNEHTGTNFTGKHTLRLGAEHSFGTFYTRLGYNYQAGGYEMDAWKWIPVNSVQTNTDYANLRSTQNFTCGMGYRGDSFYADAALLYSRQSAEFFPFDNPNLDAAKLSSSLVKGMVTVGVRF